MDRHAAPRRLASHALRTVTAFAIGCTLSCVAHADPFFFSNGSVDGLMASASRPSSTGKFEIETADDFVLTKNTRIDSVTFIGLLPSGLSLASVSAVNLEIYHVFPKDSDTTRAITAVPTRVNSPSDVEFDGRDGAQISYAAKILASTFTVLNSVQAGGIHPIPGQKTLGNGPVTGEEVEFTVSLLDPITLGPDHYFFVPQVSLTGAGDFLWLSSVRPIVAPGTPFAPDLQSWTRDQFLDPDWLRIGTDIVGTGTFNAAFTLTGQTVPEPVTLALLGAGLVAAGATRRRRRR